MAQPIASNDAGAWDAGLAGEIIARHIALEGAALPILHALQEAFGYVPAKSEPMMAEALNISRAELRGIISFYHDFRRAPAGRHVLKLCRAEACQAVGAVAIAERMLGQLGLHWGETTRDGSLTVEPSYCLGLCACAPAALLDGEPLARLTDQAMAALVQQAARP